MLAMFTEASDAFGLAVTGLGRSRVLGRPRRHRDAWPRSMVRARWAGGRRPARRHAAAASAGYALTADAIGLGCRKDEGGRADRMCCEVRPARPGRSTSQTRTETMTARLAESQAGRTGCTPVPEAVPKPRGELLRRVPAGQRARAVRAAQRRRARAPARHRAGLFYARAARQATRRTACQPAAPHRAYWLAPGDRPGTPHLCDTAVPALRPRTTGDRGHCHGGDQAAAAQQEAERRYQRRLQRGLHPGL